MSTLEEQKTDWSNDDDDDNWDDWGDAEDNIPESDGVPTNVASAATITTKKHNNNTSENTNRNNETKDSNDNNSRKGQQTQESIPQETTSRNSWGNVWKPWGGVVSSVFSTASEGLGNITSTVSQGLNNVIGVPDPEEMARINAAEAAATKATKEVLNDDVKTDATKVNESESKTEAQHQHHAAPVFGSSLVSGVTTLGSKVLNTGLDTLEGIGKKTMNILQENDPLLMNKRKMLGLEAERPNLSEVTFKCFF